MAQEITLRVYVKQDGDRTAFTLGTNGKEIAEICKAGLTSIKPYEIDAIKLGIVCKTADSYPEAVEIVGDAIEKHFAQYGINVEFVKE